jgi:hypothetical protein
MNQDRSKKSNGPAVAALLAAGLSCATLGLLTLLNEASPRVISPFLNFYSPVGPLSGKTSLAVLVYFLSWGILAATFRNKDFKSGKWLITVFALVFLGWALTFPPIYQLFTAHA